MPTKEQIKAIIKQYADKGKTQYRECCDDNESASLINYWDGYRDCAYNLLRELEDMQEEQKPRYPSFEESQGECHPFQDIALNG